MWYVCVSFRSLKISVNRKADDIFPGALKMRRLFGYPGHNRLRGDLPFFLLPPRVILPKSLQKGKWKQKTTRKKKCKNCPVWRDDAMRVKSATIQSLPIGLSLSLSRLLFLLSLLWCPPLSFARGGVDWGWTRKVDKNTWSWGKRLAVEQTQEKIPFSLKYLVTKKRKYSLPGRGIFGGGKEITRVHIFANLREKEGQG